MSIESQLVDFASQPVTHSGAIEMMRLSLFDWAACGIAGAEEPLSRILRQKALTEGGAAEATLIGGGRVPARAAALVNGATSHALDYDDTHFAHIGHPSVAVIPAVLALAERDGHDMAALLSAALVGVEASIRTGVWLGRGHYQIGFHQTATAGAIGATLACGRLLGADADQMRAALGLAATRASGLKSQFGTMGKPYNAGIAAETGVEASLLARLGMTGAACGLSDPQGLGATHHGAADIAGLDGMGTVWLFETISHKFHACCHGLHAMLEAVGMLSVDPADIAAVEIRTAPRWLTVCNTPAPATGLGAKFSYRLTCAMALCGLITGAISTFTDAACTEPRLTSLRDKVTVVGDDALSEMQARVTVTLANGEAVTAFHDLDAPIPVAERSEKLRGKAEGLLGASRANALWAAVGATSPDQLVGLLSGA